MTPRASPKVLFIVGTGRSGSTLIDQILGQTPGFCSIGELHTIWTHGLIDGDSCGCGVAVPECPFWRNVFTSAFGGADKVPAADLAATMEAFIRTRPRPILRLSRAARRQVPEPVVREYADRLLEMYRAIGAASGCRVIVDSTKVPSHALVAANQAGLDLYLLHLVRDPRGVAYSWLRNPDAGGRQTRSGVAFKGMKFLESILQWVFRVLVVEAIVRRVASGRYRQLRYEDFVADPRSATEMLVEFLGENQRPPFVDHRTVELGENHMVSGNRSKFRRGAIRIEIDDQWKRMMPLGARWACTLLTWPLMLWYQYPIRTSRRRRVAPDALACG